MAERKLRVLYIDKDVRMNEWAKRELGPFCELQLASTGEFRAAEEMIFWLEAKAKNYDAVILNPEITPADLIKGGKFVPKVHAFEFLRKFNASHPKTKLVIFHGTKPKPFPRGMIYVNSAKGNCFRKIREHLGVEPRKLKRLTRIRNRLNVLRQRIWRPRARLGRK